MTAAAIAFVVLGTIFEFTGVLLIAIDTGRERRVPDRPDNGPVGEIPAGSEARIRALETAIAEIRDAARQEARSVTSAMLASGIRLRGWSVGLLLSGIVLLGIGNILALA